jgi:hypothetical protein
VGGGSATDEDQYQQSATDNHETAFQLELVLDA